jgi:poly-beta-1,6-N-acetyl-D-glucosamine synthase
MTIVILLLTVWIALASVHLGLPLAYFALMRRVSSRRDYHLNLRKDEEPTVSLLIPTYNEAGVIERKLDNILQANYPKEKIDVIVVDSASSDKTAELARRFFETHRLKGTVLEEDERRGKAEALNFGLSHVSGELVCSSDAECEWDRDALRNATRYFSDPAIGSVSGVHQFLGPGDTLSGHVENSYRSVYRTLRIGESKIHSTPVAEGEIQLFRRGEFTRFDPTVGGDDTCAALCMVERGFRAISAEDVLFTEPTPRGWRVRFRQKVRRGQHVLQAFLRHKSLLAGNSSLPSFIFPIEFFLYVVNPVLFVPLIVLTLSVSFLVPILGYLVAGGIVLILSVPSLRRTMVTYLTNNLTMLTAIFREALGDKQLKWTKVEENRLDFKRRAEVAAPEVAVTESANS